MVIKLMRETHLLEARHLTKIFQIRSGLRKKKYLKAVDDVSFTIGGDQPIILSLAGESGSGKSTIARMILGLLKPTSGEVLYKDKNIHEMSTKEWYNYLKEVQAVFQDPYSVYNPFYKVDHVLYQPIKNLKLATSKEEAYELVVRSLKAVGLSPEEVLGKYPHQLSGGQRQRIMLARAFLIKPQIIVADEPVSMIDASLRSGILNILLDFKKEGMSCLFITHDLSVAYYLSDAIIILYKGRVVEKGSSEAVIKNPAHPYTQLLISSVPIPNPKKKWKERLELKVVDLAESVASDKTCAFYERCSQSMKICAKSPPQLVSIDKDHQVACHLYNHNHP